MGRTACTELQCLYRVYFFFYTAPSVGPWQIIHAQYWHEQAAFLKHFIGFWSFIWESWAIWKQCILYESLCVCTRVSSYKHQFTEVW